MVLKLVYFVVLLIFALFGAAFASINADKVPIDYYFGIIELPLGVMALAILGVGIGIGVLACTSLLFRLRHQNSQLRHKANIIKQEVKNLRTIPVKDR
jgi:uncharacterized integral membrane protein